MYLLELQSVVVVGTDGVRAGDSVSKFHLFKAFECSLFLSGEQDDDYILHGCWFFKPKKTQCP